MKTSLATLCTPAALALATLAPAQDLQVQTELRPTPAFFPVSLNDSITRATVRNRYVVHYDTILTNNTGATIENVELSVNLAEPNIGGGTGCFVPCWGSDGGFSSRRYQLKVTDLAPGPNVVQGSTAVVDTTETNSTHFACNGCQHFWLPPLAPSFILFLTPFGSSIDANEVRFESFSVVIQPGEVDLTVLSISGEELSEVGIGMTLTPLSNLATCVSTPNSLGVTASLEGFGALDGTDDLFYLRASDGPAGASALLISSDSAGFVPMLGGGAGNLCLGGTLVRWDGLVSSFDAAGEILWRVPLDEAPAGAMLAPGMTVHFQAWYRDMVGGSASSNLTSPFASVAL